MILFLALFVSLCFTSRPTGSVHLSKISELEFRENTWTNGARTDPIPQLNCQGDCDYIPDVIRCRNFGFDHETREYQWDCSAQLPDEIDLTDVRVSCEGYTGPGDQYVLQDSCGLFFTLEKDPNYYGNRKSHTETYDDEEVIVTTTTTTTEEEYYEEQQPSGRYYQSNNNPGAQRVYQRSADYSDPNDSWVLGPTVILIIIVGIVLVFCLFCTNSRNNSSGGNNYTPRSVDRSFVRNSAPSAPPYSPEYSGQPRTQHVHHHHTPSYRTSGTSNLGAGLTGFALGRMTAGNSGVRYPVNRGNTQVHYHNHGNTNNVTSRPRKVVKKKTTTTTTTTRRAAPSSSSRSSSGSGMSTKSKTGGTNSR